MPAPAADKKLTKDQIIQQQAERMAQLEFDIAYFGRQVVDLRSALTKAEMGRIEDANKWRAREQDLGNELKLAKKGAPSACACPAGKCMKLVNDKSQMCWMQWSDTSAMRHAATQKLDAMVRDANHPGRLNIDAPVIEQKP